MLLISAKWPKLAGTWYIIDEIFLSSIFFRIPVVFYFGQVNTVRYPLLAWPGENMVPGMEKGKNSTQ